MKAIALLLALKCKKNNGIKQVRKKGSNCLSINSGINYSENNYAERVSNTQAGVKHWQESFTQPVQMIQ